MTITRANIATYLHTQFSALTASIGQTLATEAAAGYGPDIDLALRKLGVARADVAAATLEDSQEEAVFALASYYTARRVWRQLGDRVDNTMGETAYKFDGQRKQAEAIMKDAQKQCAALGYDVTGDG